VSTIEFIIFDLDGTLVDSEAICNRAFIDLLPELGNRSSIEALVQMNRGRKFAEILSGLELSFNLELDAGFERRYRKRVEELFSLELQPIEGVPEMLKTLDLPKCIASNAPLAKISHALEVCGLVEHFEGNIYSSYEIGAWKPDPGLYQHTISDAGFRPEQCVVVEDSEVGIRAAEAAGIGAFLYAPERSFSNEENCIVFQSMDDLADLIAHRNNAAQQCAAAGRK
jgi:HAD superfamily hydrolase (TIGR01509 family)